jgi:hypothetical protein
MGSLHAASIGFTEGSASDGVAEPSSAPERDRMTSIHYITSSWRPRQVNRSVRRLP